MFNYAQALIDEFERVHSSVIDMHSKRSFVVNTYVLNIFAFVPVALLSGARNDKNTDLAQTIYDRIKTLITTTQGSLTSAAVLLANTYASTGDIEKASDIRFQLGKSGAKKKIGKSTTVVNGEVYVSSNSDDNFLS